MPTPYPQKIRKMREKQGFSQGHMAKQLGMTRPTYSQIETGKRDITLAELQKIAAILGFAPESLLADREPAAELSVELPKPGHSPARQEMRILVSRASLKKFKAVLLYLLEKVGAMPHIGETTIYKLLYFVDFDYYEKFEEQLIGATYIKNKFGPTPVEFKKIVDKMEADGEITRVRSKYFQHEQKKYLPLHDPDLSCLSARELAHIDEVLARLGGKNATELSQYSHQDVPWITAQNGRKIEYEAVFYRTPKTSVRNYDDPV